MRNFYYPVFMRFTVPLMFVWQLFLCLGYAEGLEWKRMGYLSERRLHYQSALIDKEKILVFGGFVKQYGVQSERLRGVVSTTSEIIDIEHKTVKQSARMAVGHALGVYVQTMDSNIIIISGLDSDSTTTRVCELYDRKNNCWRVLGSLLIGRHHHTALMLNNEEILVVGGHAEGNYSAVIAEAEILNIRTGVSKLVYDFPAKTSRGAALTSSVWKPGKKLFIGGRTSGSSRYRITTIYSYDPTQGVWSAEGNFPDGVCTFSYTRIGNNSAIVCVGGIKANYYFTNSAHSMKVSGMVSLETERGFVHIGNLLLARHSATTQSWNDDICLVIGGSNGHTSFSQTEWFDIRTGRSCLGPSLIEPHYDMASYSFPQYDESGKQIGARVIVIGGIGANNLTLNSIEILETNDLVYVETPSEQISLLHWKKIFSSTRFIGILILFISILVFALMYLLYQIVQIRKKSQAFARGKA